MQPPPVELGPGVALTLQTKDNKQITFQISGMIGQGSFGGVWGASYVDNDKKCVGNAAIKELFCETTVAHDAAVAEGELLLALSEECKVGTEAEIGNIPRVLALQVEPLGHDEWRVLLAMTRVPGESLAGFLKSCRGSSDEVVPGAANSSAGLLTRCAKACSASSELLLQFSTMMNCLGARVYHRDLHARNILVEHRDDSGPRFGLVDFGLAVNAERWRGGLWRRARVGGDCRYWPASAWMMLEKGVDSVCEREELQHEYKACLDWHSLGITAIQVLVEMSAPPRQSAGGADAFDDADRIGLMSTNGTPSWQTDLFEAWRCLWSTWDEYWIEVTHYWVRVFAAFRMGSSFQEVREEFPKEGVCKVVEDHCLNLRVALLGLAEACQHHSKDIDASNLPLVSNLARVVPSIVGALASMISGGKAVPSWRSVEALLLEKDGLGERESSIPAKNANTDVGAAIDEYEHADAEDEATNKFAKLSSPSTAPSSTTSSPLTSCVAPSAD